MAHVVSSDHVAAGPGTKAEQVLLEALRDGLPDDFFVYHRLHFLDEGHAHEGEADFLVLHRERGILVIECKGHGVKRTGAGAWVRTLGVGREEPLKESPFEQAQRTAHELTRLLEPKVRRYLGWSGMFPFAFGHAVAFPLARIKMDSDLPLEAPREVLYDSSDVWRIGERVVETMGFWARNSPKGIPCLEPWQFDKFRRKVLHPALNLVPGLGASLEAEGAAFVRLTQEQAWVIDALLENRQFRVVGGAGTGKTLLALEAARRLAEGGRSTLLLCFNKALGKHLAAEVAAWGFDSDRVRAAIFHDLCREAFERLGLAFEEPRDEDRRVRFYNHEAPEVLLKAFDDGLMRHWDAVVVDEGQDFAVSWWHTVETRLGDSRTGKFFVFYDPIQSIFGRESTVPEELPVLRLSRNLRNTRRITEALWDLSREALWADPRCPEGEPVHVHPAGEPGERRERVEALVKKLVKSEGLTPDQITILTPHRSEHSSLAGVQELGGVTLATGTSDRAGAILHTTISAFKGLESDAVILVDVDPADSRCDRRARYVAASRARHILHVFCDGDWLS